jgi:hypothetical protein
VDRFGREGRRAPVGGRTSRNQKGYRGHLSDLRIGDSPARPSEAGSAAAPSRRSPRGVSPAASSRSHRRAASGAARRARVRAEAPASAAVSLSRAASRSSGSDFAARSPGLRPASAGDAQAVRSGRCATCSLRSAARKAPGPAAVADWRCSACWEQALPEPRWSQKGARPPPRWTRPLPRPRQSPSRSRPLHRLPGPTPHRRPTTPGETTGMASARPDRADDWSASVPTALVKGRDERPSGGSTITVVWMRRRHDT